MVWFANSVLSVYFVASKGTVVYALRFDLLVDWCLFVEVKAVDEVHPINKAQLLSYMQLLEFPLGLIIRFNERN